MKWKGHINLSHKEEWVSGHQIFLIVKSNNDGDSGGARILVQRGKDLYIWLKKINI